MHDRYMIPFDVTVLILFTINFKIMNLEIMMNL